MSLLPWRERVAWAEAREDEAGGLHDVIEDEGPGFDFEGLARAHLAEADGLNGRGIHLARCLSFDEVRFEGRGHRVVATLSADSRQSCDAGARPAGPL